MVARGSRDHFGELWDPLHISAMAEARNLKFGRQNDHKMTYREKLKIWVKEVARGSRDHFGEFWEPLHISAMAEARNSKSGMQIDRKGYYRKK